MLPLLSLGFSGIYLPLGDNLAGFQFVDWDVLAAVQLLNSLQAQSPMSCTGPFGSAMCFLSAHDMCVSACLCTVILNASTARSHNTSLGMKHDTLTD